MTIEDVLNAHTTVKRTATERRGGRVSWDNECQCGERLPWGTRVEILSAINAHVADAIRAHLTSDETVQRSTAAYWNTRQGVPVGSWLPPIDLDAMRAALTAATEDHQ